MKICMKAEHREEVPASWTVSGAERPDLFLDVCDEHLAYASDWMLRFGATSVVVQRAA